MYGVNLKINLNNSA